MKIKFLAALIILALAATAAFAQQQTDQKAREAAKAALEGVGQLADEIVKLKKRTPTTPAVPGTPTPATPQTQKTIIKNVGLSTKEATARFVEVPKVNPTGWAAGTESRIATLEGRVAKIEAILTQMITTPAPSRPTEDVKKLQSEVTQLRNELEDLKNRKGEPGRDADPVDPTDVAEVLKTDPAFIAEVTGPPGRDGHDGHDGAPGLPGRDGTDGRDADPARLDRLETGQLRLAKAVALIRLDKEQQAFCEAAKCVVILGGNYDDAELSAPEVAKALGVKPERLATDGVARLIAGGMSRTEAEIFLKVN